MPTGWAQLPSSLLGAPEFGTVRERRNNRTLTWGVGQSCSLSLSGPPTSSAPVPGSPAYTRSGAAFPLLAQDCRALPALSQGQTDLSPLPLACWGEGAWDLPISWSGSRSPAPSHTQPLNPWDWRNIFGSLGGNPWETRGKVFHPGHKAGVQRRTATRESSPAPHHCGAFRSSYSL